MQARFRYCTRRHLDERISKIALEGMVASYQTIIQQRIHRQVFEQVIPGVLRSYDLRDVVASIRRIQRRPPTIS